MKTKFKDLKMPRKSKLLLYSVIAYLSMILFFFRSSHRMRFDAFQYFQIFIGFQRYHVYLHIFLGLLNTYSAYIIGLLMVPFILDVDIE